MIVISGSFRVAAEELDAARPAMAAMIAASRAEDGCLEYSYAEDVLEPGLIRVTETWTSREALDDHQTSEHLLAWRQTWPALGIHSRQLMLYHSDGGAEI